MSTEHEPVLSPKGCPIENFPEDPERLFTANGLTLDYPRIGWIAAGCCTFLATAISLVLIYRHYQYYTKPNQQRYIVRMLLMVPIYAITSWFSFVYVREAIYYETIRVFYEAFVIASFLILLLQYLGDSLEDQKRALKRHKKTERWFFPMCCLKYNPSRPHFLQYMKWGILQYVPLNVLGSLLTVVLETQGTYCESSWNPKFGHVWILFINFTSVTLATYFLIMFYFTIRTDLKEYEPFYKFLAIKLVIFFSFWQSLVVEGFVYYGYIKASKYWSTGDISIGINALLIDFEMVIFAIIHLKAFSYKPYVPKVPNPDLPPPEQQQQEALLSSGGDGGNREGGNGDAALASLSVDTLPTAAAGGRTQQQQTGAGGAPKRKPAPSAALIDKKGDKKSKSKKKDQGPPEKIMDFTQKTPIWRGILDSFNPLDTIRELAYGCKYMYRWIRGVPVDKDSRRLLDLEVAFGRVRPEVPYTPTEEELKKERKKKREKKLKEKEKRRKERKKMGLDTDEEDEDEEGGSSNDDDEDDDDDDESDSNGDKDLEKGANRDNSNSEREDRRRRDADGDEGTSAGQGPVSRYRQFQDNNNNGSYQGGRGRRADAAYDMGEGGGGGAGSGTKAYGPSNVARKPVKHVKKTAATNANLPHLERDPSIKLEKADAARTERATLPDIQLEPVERKIALSGLYVDLPLSPVNENVGSPGSSVDIPIPMQYRHDHRHQYQPYNVQESAARGGGSEWDYERRQQQRPRDHRLEIDQEPTTSRFEYRDRDLERAAAVGVEPASYVLPIPVQPISPEPHAPAVGSSRGGDRIVPPVDVDAPPRGGLTRLANDNFVTKGSRPYQFDRDFDDSINDNKSNGRNNNGGKGFTREPLSTTNDPRIAAISHYGQQQQQGGVHNSHYHHLHHQRGDSADTSVLSMSTTTDSLSPTPLGAGREGFYHHREASRSDPELSHYGLDHEHYLERMHYLEEQDRQAQYYLQLQQQQQLLREERRRSQLPMQSDPPEPSSSSSAPVVPGSVHDAVAVAGGVTSVTAPDHTSVVIQGEMNADQLHLLPREKKSGGGGESTLPPLPLAAPVDSQVPDPGKVPSDDSNNTAAAAADAVQEQQVVQEDPIVAEYNLLQHRQRLQDQQRTQQELQYQEQQHRRQRQLLHHQKHDSRDQQPRATMKPLPPSNSRHLQQQQQLLPRRRNSLESLTSDSSGGGFRVHDYGFRPTAGGGVSRAPKGSRYQQAYRYPMPLPQPVPPAQLYQFPQDRDLYDRQRRERANTRDRDWDGDRDRKRDRDRDRDRDQRYYYQRPQQTYQQQYSSRPFLDDFSRQPYLPQPQPQYSRPPVDTLYRSSPPPVLAPLDDRSSRPVRRAQDTSPTTRDRRDRDRDRDPRYTTDKYDNNSSRDPYYPPESPSENLFPASRYAAPFVRDYELQQRERDARQRMTRSPPIVDPLSLQQQQQPPAQRWQQHQPVDRPMIPQPGGRRGTGDINGRSRVPPSQPHRQGPGPRAYEDDGPYEEAILWTRSPPITVPAPTLRD